MRGMRTLVPFTAGVALALGFAIAPVQAQKTPTATPAAGTGKPAPAAGAKTPAPAATPAAPAAPITIDVEATRKAFLGVDVDRAAAAATSLGQSKQPGTTDALLDGLAMGLHPRVAAAALDALAGKKDPKSIDVLLWYAKNRNAQLRAKAVLALGGFDDKRATTAVYAGFHDADKDVRAASAKVAQQRKDAGALEPLLALLKKGDEAVVPALAAIATPDVARKLGELIGEAPDNLLAQCFGLILLRPDFGPETAYVEVVRALGKVPGDEAVVALTSFISATPEKPVRQSRREAQSIYEQRLGGGK